MKPLTSSRRTAITFRVIGRSSSGAHASQRAVSREVGKHVNGPIGTRQGNVADQW